MMLQKDKSYFVRKKHSVNNESGRSLLEMLGTIAIITMITLGAISGASSGLNMWRAGQAHEDVLNIIQSVSDLYSWNRGGIPTEPNDDGLPAVSQIMDFACKDNNVFDDRDCAGGEWKSVFGTDMYVSKVGGDGALTITIEAVPYGARSYLEGKKDDRFIQDVETDTENRGASPVKFISFPLN